MFAITSNSASGSTHTHSGSATPALALRILWIEDELDTIRPLVQFLTREHCRVETCSTGAASLELARHHRYDVVVLDYKLPDMSGIDVLTHLRREGIGTPVIVLTGYGTPEVAFKAGRLGVVAFKAKPIRGAELLESVRQAASTTTDDQLRPLFRRPGSGRTSESIRRVLKFVDDTLSSNRPSEPLEIRLRALIASSLPDRDLTFFEFVAAIRAFRPLNDESRRLPLTLIDQVRTWLVDVSKRDFSAVDHRAAYVLSRFESAGNRWRAVTEEVILAELDMHRSTLWRMLKNQLGLSFPQCRGVILLRRAVQELAETDEQVAQIAYVLGYDDARELDRTFALMLRTSPTAFRSLLRGVI
jgi:CheY-like chemotaxis protein/AraC-like DNA-binding protein